MYVFVTLTPWQDISKAARLLKLTVSNRKWNQFCTNSLKEIFLIRFKTVSDVHFQ